MTKSEYIEDLERLEARAGCYATEAENLGLSVDVNGPTARGNYWVNLEIPIPNEIDIAAIVRPTVTPKVERELAEIGNQGEIDDDFLTDVVTARPGERFLRVGISIFHSRARTPEQVRADVRREVDAQTSDWQKTIRKRFAEVCQNLWNVNVDVTPEPIVGFGPVLVN